VPQNRRRRRDLLSVLSCHAFLGCQSGVPVVAEHPALRFTVGGLSKGSNYSCRE